MESPIEKIKNAAEGLLFMSESDYPFEVVELQQMGSDPASSLRKLTGVDESTPVERQTLDYFFRNQVKEYKTDTEEKKKTIRRFLHLKTVLQEQLADIAVYRIGTVQVDAFVIGKLPNDSYAGLRTKLIET